MGRGVWWGSVMMGVSHDGGVQNKICKTKVQSLKINKGCGHELPPRLLMGI